MATPRKSPAAAKRSGNPAIRPKAGPTPASAWKKSTEVEDLELPSGNVCRLKRPGMEKLLAANMIPDSLTPMVERAITEAKGNKAKQKAIEDAEMAKLMSKPEMVADMFKAFDRIVAECVVEPEVRLHLVNEMQLARWRADESLQIHDLDDLKIGADIPDSLRDPEYLYTDDIDMEDKLYIFQYVVGGTRDIERFRAEQRESVVGLLPSEDLELPSE